jgi:hypothetical protein
MDIQPTPQKIPKGKPSSLFSKLNGHTDAAPFRKKIEKTVADAPTEEKLLGLSSLDKSSELQKNPSTPLQEILEQKKRKRNQFGPVRQSKQTISSLASLSPTQEESMGESITRHLLDQPRRG